MEMKVQIPFQQLLTVVRSLTPTQKERLKQELTDKDSLKADKATYIDMLLNGPVFTEDEIKVIEENTKSISKWRTKS